MSLIEFPLAIGLFIMVFMLLWFAVNVIVYEFTDTDKPFLVWLRNKP